MGSGVGSSDADVVEPAVETEGDGAAGVDDVVTDAVVGFDASFGGGFGSGGIDRGWGGALRRDRWGRSVL